VRGAAVRRGVSLENSSQTVLKIEPNTFPVPAHRYTPIQKNKKYKKKNTGNADANGVKDQGRGQRTADGGRGISAYVAPET